MSLVTFTHAVARASVPTTDTDQLRALIGRVQPQPGADTTALADATYAALVAEEVADTRSLVLLFIDGVDTGSWLSQAQVVETARRAGRVVYGIAVRGSGSSSFLREVSDATGGDAIEVESTRNLGAVFVRTLEEFRNRYLVSFSPTGMTRPGWHRLEVRVKGRRVDIKARPGYVAH